MDLDTFRDSLEGQVPPPGLDAGLQALWWDAKGEWERAHALVQDDPGADAAWVHAYLHRREGDLGNAAYWYRRAARPLEVGSLEAEWATIGAALIARNARA